MNILFTYIKIEYIHEVKKFLRNIVPVKHMLNQHSRNAY